MPLDPDNMLLADCTQQYLDKINTTHVAFAYPHIKRFEDSIDIMGTFEYCPSRFIAGNYIDAMALIRKAVWSMVERYHDG